MGLEHTALREVPSLIINDTVTVQTQALKEEVHLSVAP